MKLLKGAAIALFLAMAAALVVLSASAQQPTQTPHVSIAVPVNPPHGWTPRQWTLFRAHCQAIADKAAAHQAYTKDDWSVEPLCASAATEPPPPDVYPSPVSSGVSEPRATPAPTPLPTAAGPASALDTNIRDSPHCIR